ncbi:MAG: hypothetical protein ACNA8W_11125 [Bradymonadaceae bacterium]
MDTQKIIEEATDVLQSIFQKGSRFQAEKVGVMVGYLIIVFASVAWAMGGSNEDNELGATFRSEHLPQLDQQLFYIDNASGTTWTNVRIVFDERYLHTVDRVSSGESLSLKPEDFEYFYHIPRPWGREDWEELETSPKPGELAPSNLRPKLLQIRAVQGRLDMPL